MHPAIQSRSIASALISTLLLACTAGLPPAAAGASPAPLLEGDRLLDVHGAQIAVHIRGRGPVCLVHPGGPGLEWSYLRMPEVEKTLTLVYIEPLGTGASSRADKAQLTRRRYAEDIEGIRAALQLDRIYLLGHSYGGAVAQLYAILHPERLTGLILEDTTPRFDEAFGNAVQAGLARFEHEPWYADAMAAWAAEDKLDTDEETTQIARREMPSLFGEWTRRHAEFEPLVAALRAFAAPLRGSQFDPEPFDVRAALRSVKVPALILVGRLDAITGLPFAEEIRAALPDARLVVLEHSGHMGHVEEPAAFAEAIRAFVERR